MLLFMRFGIKRYKNSGDNWLHTWSIIKVEFPVMQGLCWCTRWSHWDKDAFKTKGVLSLYTAETTAKLLWKKMHWNFNINHNDDSDGKSI